MTLSIKELPLPSRPRERLLLSGAGALSDAEVVSLLFGGDREAAGEVVARLGPPSALRAATVDMLCEVPGVGPTRAAQIVAAVELGRRAAASVVRGDSVRHPEHAQALFADLALLEQEEMHVAALDGRHRLLGRNGVARGTHNVVHVSPRELFRWALRQGASSVVVAHNHPSGDPAPSADDVALTARLRGAGSLVGVPLLDHVIVATEGWYSFESGMVVRR